MKSFLHLFFHMVFSVFIVSQNIFAQIPVTGSPEAVGLSTARLPTIEKTVGKMIEDQIISGAVVLVGRNGKVAYLNAVGTQSPNGTDRLQTDHLFRIASMSKAVTTVCAMILYEEGHFLLDDPLSMYIPEFKNMKVMKVNGSDDGPPYQLVDAKNPVTIRHLLNHTSGITYKFWGQSHIAELYHANKISDGLAQTEGTLKDNIVKLAKMPLLHEPGERMAYGLNTDVLGYLIEVVSGQPLDKYFNDRLFEPLKMADTYFFVPPDKKERLVTVSLASAEGGLKKVQRDVITNYDHFSPDYHYDGHQTYFSGGAGLVSTAGDYYRFLQMLLNKGEMDGVRILGKKTVELITSPQDIEGYAAKGEGFGFGFSVSQGPQFTGHPESAGTFSWSGYYSTFFFVDPVENLIGIIMTQTRPYNSTINRKFRNAVYQSIVK